MLCTSQTCNNSNTSGDEYTTAVLWNVIQCDTFDKGIAAWNITSECDFQDDGLHNTSLDNTEDLFPWPDVEFDCSVYADNKERLHPYSNINFSRSGSPDDKDIYGENRLRAAMDVGRMLGGEGWIATEISLKQFEMTTLRIDWCTCCKNCMLYNIDDNSVEFDKGSLFIECKRVFTYFDFIEAFQNGEPGIFALSLKCPYAIDPTHDWFDGTCPYG